MPDATYTRGHLTSEISTADPEPSRDSVGIDPVPPSGAVTGSPETAREDGKAPGRNREDCPSCVALRASSRLLAESALYLIDRNAVLTASLAAYRERDRQHAEVLLGLVFPETGPAVPVGDRK